MFPHADLCDFDGTIVEQDVSEELLASPARRRERRSRTSSRAESSARGSAASGRCAAPKRA
jgi:hypothetical protein